MCPTRTAPGRRVPNVQLCKAAAGTLLPPFYSYSAGTGSGLFARPVARIAWRCTFTPYSAALAGIRCASAAFSCRGHGGNRLPPPGRDGHRRAGIRAFRGFRMPCRAVHSALRWRGGRAAWAVSSWLSLRGCCCGNTQICDLRPLLLHGGFVRPAAIYPMTVATRRRPGARLRNSQR